MSHPTAESQPTTEQTVQLHETVPLVPMEERAPGFDVVLRGYDREQVDRHIAWLEDLLAQAESTSAEHQGLAEQARADAMRAHQQAAKAQAELERGRPTFDALGERIASMLTLAEEEADHLREQAHRDVEQITADAHALQQSTQSQRDEIVGRAEQEAQAIVAAARQQAEALLADSKRRIEALEADAHRRLAELSAQRDEIRTELARLHQQLAALTRIEG
jgi:dsDNA-specific endonuclease/ATPase MutS2